MPDSAVVLGHLSLKEPSGGDVGRFGESRLFLPSLCGDYREAPKLTAKWKFTTEPGKRPLNGCCPPCWTAFQVPCYPEGPDSSRAIKSGGG